MKSNLLLAMATALISRNAVTSFIQRVRQFHHQNLPFHRSVASLIRPTYVTTQRGTYHPSNISFIVSRVSNDPSANAVSKEDGHELGMTAEELQSPKSADVELLQPTFKKGDLVLVEVIYFGPLGASVDVVAHNSHDPSDCITQDEPALGRGMILQQEINYFRKGRGGVDVVKFEVLPGYFENAREVMNHDGDMEVRLDISLRPPGGRAKAEDLSRQILRKLKELDGPLDVGDKSSPEEINQVFPGASKGAFKKAVSNLYRRGLVSPGRKSTTLM